MNKALLCCILWLLTAVNVFASDRSSVFYPLPFEQQGQFIIAKKLFSGPQGGLWIHDVRGQLRFFDGQHMLPRSGSVHQDIIEHLTYHQDYFWFAEGNQLYRFKPAQPAELMMSMGIGRQIDTIGSNGDYIWMAGKEFFYTYNTRSGEFDEYPLSLVYQRNIGKKVAINDAVLVEHTWVLATTSGVYIGGKEGFHHIRNSGRSFIQTLHYSNKRRELVIGTLNGAKLIDINSPEQLPMSFAHSHILTIEETDTGYWLGSENGLYVYQFMNGSVQHFTGRFDDDYSLTGNYIYDLMNDGQGGLWIATNKGIKYYSLYNRLFGRFWFSEDLTSADVGTVTSITTGESGEWWIATDRGAFRYDLRTDDAPVQIARGMVHDVAVQGNRVWLAKEDGLVYYQTDTGKLKRKLFPAQLQQRPIEKVLPDNGGGLWVATEQGLMRYYPEQSTLDDYGFEWLVAKDFTTKISALFSSVQGMTWIGTDHGHYIYDQGQLRLDKLTQRKLGQALNVAEVSDGNFWVVNSFGTYRYNPRMKQIASISLYEPDLKALCAVSTSKGVWLGTSKGLSFYTTDGVLLRHFGAPFGLVNNEFLPGICTYSAETDTLIFGSKLGLVYASQADLLSTEVPASSVKIGQVLVDMEPYRYAPDKGSHYRFPHGKAITFTMGVLPDFDLWNLEYRLNGQGFTDNEPWTPFRGAQLTIDYLLPGDYTLELRTSGTVNRAPEPSRLSFTVATPWFMSGWFISACVLGAVVLAGLFYFWRSRQVWKLNKVLREKVDLRTSQLKHQSEALLHSNTQLKKQFRTRQDFIDHLALEAHQYLTQFLPSKSTLADQEQAWLNTAQSRLQQIIRLKPNRSGGRAVFELNSVCDAVLLTLSETFKRAGVTFEFVGDGKPVYVAVQGFNLDLVLHGMLYNSIRRCKRGDKITLGLVTGTEGAGFVVTDEGRHFTRQEILNYSSVDKSNPSADFYALTDATLAAVRRFTNASGGECRFFHNAKGETEVEVLWPAGEALPAPVSIETRHLVQEEWDVPEPEAVPEIDPWLAKVYELVDDNYQDPDFGTAQMARLLFFSERSLQRKFKNQTGKTFKEYLNEVRLGQACHLLIAGQKVSDVAFDTGFNDPSYFSQRFKHYYGISPTQFVESNGDSD